MKKLKKTYNKNMICIVGLGNPGEKFKSTPHNMGFLALDFFAKENNFPEFEFSKKYNALTAEGFINKEKTILLKPQTFMNESGSALKKMILENKNTQVIVLHDDIDLPLGALRIVKNRGSGGHKGVESIVQSIGNKNLVRLRLGVQPNGKKPKNPEKFVVKSFTKKDEAFAYEAAKESAKALMFYIENGLEKTMNEYNGRNKNSIKKG